MSETPPKVLDLVQQLEDSLTRAKEARDAKVSGDEHPSGLRDAIAAAITEWEGFPGGFCEALDAILLRHLVAWLSVVSEGEIEAAARAIANLEDLPHAEHYATVRKALAASRGLLVPRIESDAGSESGDIGGQR